MSTTPMANMINPQVMGDMITAKIEALLKITPYAKVDTTLQGVPGDTKTVPSWRYIGDAEDVAEGAEVDLTEMHTDSETFTIKKAMKAVGLTQEAINSGYGDPVGQAETQLAKSIAGKVDNDVFAAALKSNVTSGDGTTQVSYAGVVDVVDAFNEEDITDKVMFVHPKMVTKLRKDSDFISADKYNNNVMVTGEIGMICQTRIVPSKKVPLIKYEISADGTEVTTENQETYAGATWDAENKAVVTPAVGVKVSAVATAYYICPCLKLEPSSAETEFTETELPAITIFLKKDTQTDTEWKPRTQTHEITTAKYYGVALTNEAKVVVAKFKV
jgi:N4-gp56 family major capsid protein